MKKHPLSYQVISTTAYQKTIYNLHKKYHEDNKLYFEDDVGITLSDAYFGQRTLIKALKHDILAEKFKFHALKPHLIQLEEKNAPYLFRPR